MEKAVCLINDMFSVHGLCLFVTLAVSHLGFEGETVVLIAPVPRHCCTFTFCYFLENITEVKRMHRPETEAIKTHIQPLKPKRKITKITNSKNTKRKYGQPCEQLLPKGGHSATQTEQK